MELIIAQALHIRKLMLDKRLRRSGIIVVFTTGKRWCVWYSYENHASLPIGVIPCDRDTKKWKYGTPISIQIQKPSWLRLPSLLCRHRDIVSKTCSIILSGLLMVFAIALGFNAMRGLDVACGCFSTSTESGDPVFYIFRDLVMLLPGLIIIFFHPRKKE